MSNPIQNLPPAMLRVDYARADQYIYPDAPKLSFMQKLGRGLGKFISFAGPIGAAVSAIALPGIGIPIAAGLYGLTKVSQDQLAKSQIRDQIKMSGQPQPVNIQLPGLFEQGPMQAGQAATDFIAPRSMEPEIGRVVVNRNQSLQSELNKIK